MTTEMSDALLATKHMLATNKVLNEKERFVRKGILLEKRREGHDPFQTWI